MSSERYQSLMVLADIMAERAERDRRYVAMGEAVCCDMPGPLGHDWHSEVTAAFGRVVESRAAGELTRTHLVALASTVIGWLEHGDAQRDREGAPW